MNYYSLKKEELLKLLQTSEQGLSEKEAEKRLQKYGKNQLKETDKLNPLKIFFLQFKSFLIYILLAATIVSLIIKHYVDASVIFAIIILNASLGFYQQYKAERAIKNLRKFFIPKSQVIREGRLREIESSEIVPGDILILREGSKITSDCRILKSEDLQVNEAVLTGESIPVKKSVSVLKNSTPLYKHSNMLYAGTLVLNGNCRAVVVETGMKTEFGKIAETVQEIKISPTPMQKKIDSFAKKLGIFILSILAVLFVVAYFINGAGYEIFLTIVALAVSAVPEGLPAIITISLVFATRKMLDVKTLVRRIPATESLGEVTVICSDKTGTITEEKMQVTEIFSDNSFFKKKEDKLMKNNKKINVIENKSLFQLLKTSVLCNNARYEGNKENFEVIGDPTEAALVQSAYELNIDKKIFAEKEPKIKEIAFSSDRQMMSVIRKERREIIYAKGSDEVILKRCSKELINGNFVALTDTRKKELSDIAEKMQGKALRTLAFAFKYVKKDYKEEDFIFLGFIGMIDPPRKEVKDAIRLCKKAGIKIKMLTGDAALTARAVADEIGLKGKLMTGIELDSLNENELKQKINETEIFARINPKQKFKIISVLKETETVAVTGDGVNDILALKKADVGIAMGIRGTDVARDVSDIILLDDNFASIVLGVKEGRVVYDNTKKFTKYLLAVNFKEILLIFYSILLGLPLPLLPLQILWINLITDSFPALALSEEKGHNVMSRKPLKEKSILKGILGFILIATLIGLILEIGLLHYGLKNLDITRTRTILLTTIVMFEAFFVFTCRSDKPLKEIGIFSNKWLNYAVLLVIVLHLGLMYSPLGSLFGIVPLTTEWFYIVPLALIGVVVFEAGKLFRKK